MNVDNYIKVPLFLIMDNKICPSGKILYGKILLLAHKEGYCYADNEYLGKEILVGSRRITKLLKDLADNDYISMEYKHKFQRKIYINKDKYTYTFIKLDEIF